jgi:thiamine biosynthesis lipoprotein
VKPAPPDGAAVAPAEAPGVHRFSHEAMATVFEVRCAHPDARYARQAADAAFAVVDRLEQELSRFVGNSDVSRVNALGLGETARVGPSTLDCLLVAQRMREVTGGAFDVSLGSGLDALELDADAFTVRARRDGVRLDLGGIGKGYAVDRAAELLAGDWGLEHVLVHGGFSSVLALSAPPGADGWPLTLTAPASGQPIARLSASHRALSASGTRKGEHILDPRTGRPAAGRAAWVALPRAGEGSEDAAAIAEALSTAFMVLPEDEIAALHGRWPGLEAWLAYAPGEGEPSARHFSPWIT